MPPLTKVKLEPNSKCFKNCNIFSVCYKEMLDAATGRSNSGGNTRDVTVQSYYSNTGTPKRFHQTSTDALIWLKRGLTMLSKVFLQLLNGERDPSRAFQRAYEVVLQPHHGYMTKLAIKSAMKLGVGGFDSFLNAACSYKTAESQETCEGLPKEEREKVVMDELRVYIYHMDKLIEFIDTFYEKYGIDDLTI